MNFRLFILGVQYLVEQKDLAFDGFWNHMVKFMEHLIFLSLKACQLEYPQ